MPEKTEAEVRALRKKLDEGMSFADCPEGVTWADIDAANELEPDPFRDRKEEVG
jgi:hypothetical protein